MTTPEQPRPELPSTIGQVDEGAESARSGNEVSTSELMVLMFTDVFDSVGMKRRLGDKPYYRLLARHNQIFEAIAASIPGTRIVKATGDGFLVRMTSASAAVRASLAFQSALASERWTPEPVLVRTGIHVGEAMEVPGLRGESDVSGLAVDVAARIMSLAMPGQVLLTRTAFDDGRQYLRDADASEPAQTEVRWLAHGPYVVKGSDEALEVYEVGTVGKAPLRAPPDSDKARRSIRVEEEELLGWRPAPTLPVPGKPGWSLVRKLGEGGFGEVWLALHQRLGEQRVLKFCFDAQKLKFLRRELTLFRVMRESLGDRADIVRIHDVHLDKPPYYLESAYSEAGSLSEWARAQGGLPGLPLDQRLEIVAKIADAVAAAHGVGILHKDLKPDNILMFKGDDGVFRPRLADFGIGGFADETAARGKNITMAGFTVGPQSVSSAAASSTGTPIYMPPEVLTGKPFTTQGDVYALGVVLYQMAAGDLNRPLGHGWERTIGCEELRGDIRRSVAENLGDRFASAKELAANIRRLDARRCRRRRRRVVRVGVVVALGLSIISAVGVWVTAEKRAQQASREYTLALETKKAELDAALQKVKVAQSLLHTMLDAPNPNTGQWRPASPNIVLDAARLFLESDANAKSQPEVTADASLRLAKSYLGLGKSEYALALTQRALAYWEKQDPEKERHAEALHWYAYALRAAERFDDSEVVFTKAIAIRERLFGKQSEQYAESLYECASTIRSLQRFGDAEAKMLESVAIRREFPDRRETQVELARSFNSLARLAIDQGDFAKATAHAQESLGLRTKWLTEKHPDVTRSYITIGQIQRERGRFEEALATFRTALRLAQETVTSDNTDLTSAKFELAKTLLDSGDLNGAATISAEVLSAREAESTAAKLPLADAMQLHGLLLARTGKSEEALVLLRRAVEICEERTGKRVRQWQIALAKGALGEGLMRAGKVNDAKPLLLWSATVWHAERRSPLRTRQALTRVVECLRKLSGSPHEDTDALRDWSQKLAALPAAT